MIKDDLLSLPLSNQVGGLRLLAAPLTCPDNSGRSPGSSGYGTPSPAYPPRKESYDSPRDLNRAMGDLSVSGYGQSVSQQRRPGTSNSNRSNGSRNQGYDQGYSNQYGLRADHFQESRTAATSPARGGFQPERSMTMPTEIGNRPHRQNSDRGPYERSQSDRQYGPRPPADRQFGPQRSQPGHGYPQPYVEKHENFELLDSYYGNTNQPFINGQQQSPEEEMPNFDIAQKPHKRGASIDKHLNESGTRYEGRGDFGAQTHRSRSQPDLRGQARGPPKDAPQMPGYDQPQYDPAYGNGPRGRGPMPRGGPNMRGPNGRGRPPPAMRGGPPRGLPHPARGGPPGRDARNGPQRSPLAGQPNGRNPDGLPQHPASVRPGLVQGPPVNQDRKDQPPEQAADQSSSIPVTYKELEDLKQSAAQHPNDRKLQLQLAKKWVEAASVLADEGGRADARTTRANREKYILDAHKLIKKLVAGGSSEAMFYLADCYGQGALGLEPDNREAFKLYQSAAKLGHPQAAYRTAVCCEMGPEDGGGTNKDPLKAVEWYKRSAAMGDTPAMYKMGMIQLKGLLGQPKNPREAVVWLKRAADRADADNPHALHELVSDSSIS
jgi:TPR repeat protein